MKISDDAIADLLSKGLSQAEIARQYSCSRQAVNSRLHYGDKPKEHLRWAKYTKIYWFIIQGLTKEEIAKRAGVSESSIDSLKSKYFDHLKLRSNECRRSGAKKRSKPKEHLRWARYTKVYWFLIQGLSTKEIAKRVGITEGYVSFFKSDFFPRLKSRPGRRRKRGGMR